MLGLNSKISKEKLATLNEILATVGLEDPDHWGFQHHIQNSESYSGGSFEWSERGKNMRFLFYAFPGEPIREATVYVLDGRRSHCVYSDETIAEANRRLKELFGE